MNCKSHLTQSRPSRNKFNYDSTRLPQVNSASSLQAAQEAVRLEKGSNHGLAIARYASPVSSDSIPSPPSVSPVALGESEADVEKANSKKSANKQDSVSEDFQLEEALMNIMSLKRFLVSAPVEFNDVDIIRQFRLPTDEQISCVRWNQIFCITGTDIVRCLVYRFSLFGRDVINRKKFEEGVFSDLRNLKINVDAMLENPKSELLDFLYKRHCVRTKKKQKIFFWHSVHHEQLFIDALERELKKEAAAKAAIRLAAKSKSKGYLVQSSIGSNSASNSSVSATMATREPALSFTYDSTVPLSEQLVHIVESMPRPAALLVRETTTSLKEPSHFVSSETHAPSSHRLPTELHHPEKEYLRTPIPSHGKFALNSTNLIGHWYPETPERQLVNTSLATPQSLTYKPATRHAASEFLQQPTSASSVPSRPPTESSFHLPRNYGLSPWIHDSHSPHSGSEATDFPLEVLTKEDHNYHRYGTSPSFDTRYTEFAYSNRPAIMSDGGGHHSAQSSTPSTLGPPINFSSRSGLSPIQRSYNPHVPLPHSPDWDQFMETGFDWNVAKSPITDVKGPQVSHLFSHYGAGRVTKSGHPKFRQKAAHQSYY